MITNTVTTESCVESVEEVNWITKEEVVDYFGEDYSAYLTRIL
jgi:hypothetical protein